MAVPATIFAEADDDAPEDHHPIGIDLDDDLAAEKPKLPGLDARLRRRRGN